jgi:methylmalonyl-CoA decarboxylase subunit alpha
MHLNEIIPENPNKPYDVKDVIYSIVDYGEFLEVQRNYAPILLPVLPVSMACR